MEEIAQKLQAHPQIKRVQTNVNTGSILICRVGALHFINARYWTLLKGRTYKYLSCAKIS